MIELRVIVALAFVMATITLAAVLTPFIAIGLIPVLAFYMFMNSEYFAEWAARRRTKQLYEKARQIYQVPSPPEYCNTIPGAEYRELLINLLDGRTYEDPIPINERRFEHVHMVAQIGHGKTQALQYFIHYDLEHLRERSVVVIDSQGELIKNILALRVPKEKIVYINPRDKEYPPALNLFEDTEATNATIEIYEYIIGGILGAELTSKQGVVFRFVIRLMLEIPKANIDTLLTVFRDHTKFANYYAKIGGPTKEFFEQEFSNRQYNDTKAQVIRRIYTIMENETLYGMFATGTTKLDLGKEMDSGKLILIDTAKDELKEEGSRILGRFFIAKLVQAAQERGENKFPVHVYVDECQDYLDDRTEVFLSQLRKQRVGGFFAHQYLGQLSPKLQEAFMANTSSKLVGGVSAKDARAFASEIKSDPQWIASQPKGRFATYVRGMPEALPYDVPFFVMEDAPKRSDMDELIAYQRETYSAERAAQTPTQPAKTNSEEEDEGPSYQL